MRGPASKLRLSKPPTANLLKSLIELSDEEREAQGLNELVTKGELGEALLSALALHIDTINLIAATTARDAAEITATTSELGESMQAFGKSIARILDIAMPAGAMPEATDE